MNLITKIPDELRAGAICLYNSASLSDKAIEWKEGDPDTAHVEIYIGNGKSVASRNEIGVGLYDFRPEGLVHVRFLDGDFSLEPAMGWFNQVDGAKYGWGDIGANLDLIEAPEDAWQKPEVLLKTGMDCSHFASMFLMAGFCPQFDPWFDLRKITPLDFKIVRQSRAVWDNPPGKWVDTAAARPAAGAAATIPDLSPRAQGEQTP